MLRAGVGFNRKTRIFITHMHGDHCLGLPGIMMTMSLLGRDKKLQIYGPPGLTSFVEAVRETIGFGLTYPVEIYALIEKERPGVFYPEKARALGVPEGPLWSKLQHGFPVSLPDGRTIEPHQVTGPKRPGRKIVYTGDTRPSKNILHLAKDADLLIHDGTLDDSLEETAELEGHSTPSQAARIAKEAGVKKLILTHISARYRSTEVLAEQARKIFPNTEVAEDLMMIKVPLAES